MGRPPHQLISRERAALAALDLIDAHGLNKLSLKAVADALSVTQSSLYHHFRDKDEILSEVAILLLRELDSPWEELPLWEDRMVELCLATRRSILRHPHAAILLLHYFPRHIRLASYEKSAAGNPFSPELQLMIIEGLEKLTFGAGLFEAMAQSRGLPNMPSVDESEYPYLARAIKAAPADDESIFAGTIKIFLAGILVRVGALSRS